jgi:hypothetical protein
MVVGWIAAAVLLWFVLDTPAAHADDDDDPGTAQEVCGAFNLGVPSAEIPDDLRRNNPRINSPTLPYQVFRDLQNCP